MMSKEYNTGINIDNSAIFGEKINGIDYIDRVGIYGLAFNKCREVAILKTPKGYFLPGGGIEIGEDHRMCLEREFLEETGYEIAIHKYVGQSTLYHITKANQYVNGIGYFYIVEIVTKLSDCIEIDHELIWMEPKECITNMFLEHQGWAIAKALNN